MSKYIKTIPRNRIKRIRLYINTKGKPLKQIVAEEKPDLAITGNFYDSRFKSVCPLKAAGVVYNQSTQYEYPVLTWDQGPDISMKWLPPCGSTGKANHIANCCGVMAGSKMDMYYGRDVGGKRGRTGWGLCGDALAFVAFPDGKDGMTPEALRDEVYGLGWTDFILGDGGGKVNFYCKDGNIMIQGNAPSQNLILVDFEDEKEEKPVKHTVCLDPGHGVESPGKCSPDKTYYERDFALDIGRRVRTHLERCGVAVVMTRDNEHCPTGKADTNDLLHRAAISNKSGANLFVSLHSNAAGNEWSTAKGLMIYTSSGPMTAARNVAASAVLTRMREAGVTVRSTPIVNDIDLVVTRQTNAPAVLIEYGFHTNKDEVALLKSDDYRARLSEATAKGICDFLGVAWTGEPAQDEPWYSEAKEWAVGLGIADGTRPEEAATRAEVWTMLKRVYEAVKA